MQFERRFSGLLTNRNLQMMGVASPDRRLVREESAHVDEWLFREAALPRHDASYSTEDTQICFRSALCSELRLLQFMLPVLKVNSIAQMVAFSAAQLAVEAEEFNLAGRLLSLIEDSPIVRRESQAAMEIRRHAHVKGRSIHQFGDDLFDFGDTAHALASYIVGLQGWLEGHREVY